MLEFLDSLYFNMKFRAESFLNSLKEDESGVSAFVATILLILVVVILCAMFWKNISEWFNDTWASITGEAEKIKAP